MGFIRFSDGDGPIRPGYLVDTTVYDLSTVVEDTEDVFDDFSNLTERVANDSVRTTSREAVTIETPTEPSKVVRLEGCYEHDLTDDGFDPHVEAAGFNDLETPSLWVAPTSTLTRDQSFFRVPAQISDLRPAVELGVVIGSTAYALDPADAFEAIAGFTVCAGVAAYDDIPGLEGYKMFDSSLLYGPAIVPADGVEPERLALGIRRNGDSVDDRSTESFRFSLAEMVSYISHVMTLKPGDLITTGAPTRNAPSLEQGDELDAWVESIGAVGATVHWEGEA